MRIRVRAVIIKDDEVLLIKRTKNNSVYWVIPGGAVEEQERKEEALKRECKEELGIDVGVGEVLLEKESNKPETEGDKEYFYLCKIIGGTLGSGRGPEFKKGSTYVGKYDIEWRDIKDLKKIDLRPKEIRDFILKDISV